MSSRRAYQRRWYLKNKKRVAAVSRAWRLRTRPWLKPGYRAYQARYRRTEKYRIAHLRAVTAYNARKKMEAKP